MRHRLYFLLFVMIINPVLSNNVLSYTALSNAGEKNFFATPSIYTPQPIIVIGSPVPAVAQSIIDNRFAGYDYNKPLERKFPPSSKIGKLTLLYFPAVGLPEERYAMIDRVKYPLTPDFHLFNDANIIQIPNAVSLPQTVAFLAPNGIINKIWILREAERKNFSKYLFQ